MKELEDMRNDELFTTVVVGIQILRDNERKQGYADGKADTPFTDTEEAEKKAYEQGLNDAWEVTRKIIEDVVDGGYSSDVLREIFGMSTIQPIFKHNTAPKAIAKIKAYEDKQKQDAEIKVGDEVTTMFGSKGIVITDEPSEDGCISVWLSTRTHVQMYPVKNLSKTGRHFNQIAEVLAELRGEDE